MHHSSHLYVSVSLLGRHHCRLEFKDEAVGMRCICRALHRLCTSPAPALHQPSSSEAGEVNDHVMSIMSVGAAESGLLWLYCSLECTKLIPGQRCVGSETLR